MNKRISPPIKYFGGKGNMLNIVLKEFPKEGTYKVYIEPFGGSYSVGFAKPPAPIEIYNDLEKNVYSLYRVIADKTLFEEFKEKCDLAIYSEDLRKEYKTKLKNDNITDVDRAFYFFYVNRTSHNGIGGFSTNLLIRRKVSKSISDFLSAIDRLPEIHQRLSNVIIRNIDGIKLIERYKKYENVFFYCDPPYDQGKRGKTRYLVDMNKTEQERFLSAVIGAKAKILISGYKSPSYDLLLKNGFIEKQFEIKTIDNLNQRKTRIETLWKNY